MMSKKQDSIIRLQSVLTLINWLPLAAGILFCLLFNDVFLHDDFALRLLKFGIPPLISLFTCFGIATLCFQKGSRELSTILFGLICTLWGLLSLDVALLIIIKDAGVALKISRLDHFFLVMQLGIYIHFLNHFIGIDKKWVYIAYAVSIFFAPVSQTRWYISKMYSYPWGFFAEKNVMFDFFSLIAGFTIIATGYVLISKAFKSKESIKKKQYIFFLTGSVGEVLLSLTNIPAMSGIDFYPCGSFIFIPVLLMAYGALKHDIITFNIYTKKKVVFRILRLLSFSVFGLMAVVFVFFTSDYPNGYIISKVVPEGIPAMISFALALFFSAVAIRLGQNRGTIRLFGALCLIYSFLSLNFVAGMISSNNSDTFLLRSIDYCLFSILPGLHLHLIVLLCQNRTSRNYIVLSYFSGLLLTLFIAWNLLYTPVIEGAHFFHRIDSALMVFGMIFLVNTAYCFKLLYSYSRPAMRTAFHLPVYSFTAGFFFLAFLGIGNVFVLHQKFSFFEYGFIPFSLMGYAVFRQSLNEVLSVLNIFFQNIGRVLFIGTTALILFELKSVDLPFWYYLTGLIFWILLVRYGGGFFSTLLTYLLDRQKERLDFALRDISVELGTTHTVENVFDSVAKPLFKEIGCRGFCALLPEEGQNYYTGWEISNDKNENLSPFSTKFNNVIKSNQIRFQKDHKLLEISESISELLPQSVFEEMIINNSIPLPVNDRLRSSEILCPVFFNNKMSCLLALDAKIDGSDYSTNEIDFISKLSLVLGPYIENARILTGLEQEVENRTRDLREAVTELTVVNSIVSTVNSTLDFDEVMPAFIRQLETFIEFGAVSIQLIDKSVNELSLYRVYKKNLADNKLKPLEELTVSLKDQNSLFVESVNSKLPVYQKDYSIRKTESDFEKQLYSVIPFKSILVLPMEFQHEVIGTVMLTSDYSDTVYSNNDIERIKNYVTLIASAVNNSRLYQKVESALSVKSDFIARMSHEIRTPLNAILAMGDLLDETVLSKEQKEYVSILKNTGSLLLKILSEILDFSKLEAGKLKLNSTIFDLHLLLKNIEKTVSASLQTKGLDFECRVDDEVASVLTGDSVKLSQVLINLISNSIKFTPEGSISVTVKKSAGNGMIEFSVEDTGVGIPQVKQSTIFDRFTQAHSDSAYSEGGSGLGLSISRKMIELMGGEIHLETCEKRGSRFVFTVCLPEYTLPYPEELSAIPDIEISGGLQSKNAEIKNSENITSLQGVYALIVEDIYTNQVVIQKYLDSCGVIYDISDNGYSALEKYKKNRYDIVLMDIEMPGMDGFLTAEKIREWERGNNLSPVPIMGISAHVQPEYETAGDVSAINDFLLKPYKKKILINKINSLLGDGRGEKVKVDACLIDVVPELMKEIRAELEGVPISVDNVDYTAVEILAHGLKGASFNCELRYLGGMFNNLKESAFLKNNDDIKKNIEIILRYIESVNITYIRSNLVN